jgi:hypothetical protein
MNTLKKMLGPVWMILGPLCIIMLLYEAVIRITANPVQDVYLPWIIIIVVFTPIAAGMVIFGYYALRGEFDTTDDELYSNE